jgi:hypothetical protein
MEVGLQGARFEFSIFEASKIQIQTFKKIENKYLDVVNVVL